MAKRKSKSFKKPYKFSRLHFWIFIASSGLAGLAGGYIIWASTTSVPTPVYPNPALTYAYDQPGYYGVNVPATLIPDLRGSDNDAKAQQIVSQLNSTGAKWLRTDAGTGLYWSLFQNTNCGNGLCDVNKLPGFDILAAIDHVTMRQAPFFCSLSYSPGQENNFTLNQWREVVDCVSKKFKGKIKAYEIWNEPTLSVFQLGYQNGNPARYYEMLKIAYQTIKANDPSATVIGLGGAFLFTGGETQLLADSKNFAARLHSLKAGSYMDAISVHPYPWGDYRYGAFEAFESNWKYYSQLFPGKPVWVTETGHRSTEPGSQSEYLYKAYSSFINLGASQIFWYELKDELFDPNFGLYTAGDSAKPVVDYHKQYLTVPKNGMLRVETAPAAGVVFTIRPSSTPSATPMVRDWGINWERLQKGTYRISFTYSGGPVNGQAVKLPPSQNFEIKAGMTTQIKLDVLRGSLVTQYYRE